MPGRTVVQLHPAPPYRAGTPIPTQERKCILLTHGHGILITHPFIEVVAAVKINDASRAAGKPVSIPIDELNLNDCIRAWEVLTRTPGSA